MTEEEFSLPDDLPLEAVPALIETACRAIGLSITQNTSLAQYPGSRHWHLKLGRQPGTLEITWWPAQRRAWFKIAAGRQGLWLTEARRAIRQHLNSETPRHA
jgi:hypothetical protein